VFAHADDAAGRCLPAAAAVDVQHYDADMAVGLDQPAVAVFGAGVLLANMASM